MSYTKSSDEIQRALNHQVKALTSSCQAFDKGEDWEAARIAAAIHLLLYDSGGRSRSILHQLDSKNSIEFVCSAGPIDSRNMLSSHPLVAIRSDPNGMRYVPLLDQSPYPTRNFNFKKWWKGPVFAAPRSKWTLSRGELICAIRNQDGGGHFDGALSNEKYVEFSRAPQWVIGMADGEDVGLMGLELNTIRQIGWEVLQTLERAGLG